MADYSGLIRQAMDAIRFSYAPYSRYHVAAALEAKDGRVFTGVNIENAAYTPTICAERTAFFKAVSEGVRDFSRIAIVACDDEWLEEHGDGLREVPAYASPCGVCRQVMREFCDPDSFEIITAKTEEDFRTYTLKQLLPDSFGPEWLL